MGTLDRLGLSDERALVLPADEELDRYRWLAYLQRIDAHYRERKLYPHLDELRVRLDQLAVLRRRCEELVLGKPREITGLDLAAGELRRAVAQKDEALRLIEGLMERMVPDLKDALERGDDLRGELAASIRFEPVGIVPLTANEGYLLIHQGVHARVYAYALTLPRPDLERAPHQGVRTHYVADLSISMACTYEQVKAELIRQRMELPNPAMFAFTSTLTMPAIETFVPLAKQLVYELVTERRY